MVISLVEVDIYYYSICYYGGITQSEVAFLTETNIGGVMEWRYLSASWQEISWFNDGYKFAVKKRYHSQRTPRICCYIGYEKGEIEIGLSALYQW